MVQSITTATATSAPQTRQYLTFSLAGEMFAVGTLDVKEIIEYGGLTSVPMMPGFIRGVINLRGAVVPVIDLGARFGGQTTRITRRSCVVILEVAGDEASQDIGMVVDAVSEVLEISPADIEPPPRFGARIRSDFILGMAKVDGKLVILLDVGQVLSADDIATLSSVATNEQVPAAD